MKLSRFTGATMQDALRQVKATLGEDAVLLDTQPVRGGVVVTAAIDWDAAEVARRQDVAREGRALASAAYSAALDGPDADDVARSLARQGVDGALAAALLRAITTRVPAGPVGTALGDVFRTGAPVAAVECFIGPPGDGKTTTVVKLAARARRAGAQVALISTDTHRVGAAAELEVYGRALGVPTARATSPAELQAAVRAFAQHDRVLIDTAGVGPGEIEARAELVALLDGLDASVARTMVASAGAGAVAAARTWETFAALQPSSGIVTKRDLAPGAPILTELWRAQLPIAHLTTGRRIPDDIETATPARLAESLLAA